MTLNAKTNQMKFPLKAKPHSKRNCDSKYIYNIDIFLLNFTHIGFVLKYKILQF